MGLRSVLTFDLHSSDRPDDLSACADAMASRNMRVSFFVPTNMLEMRRFRAPLLRLQSEGHELGTHGHLHDREEMIALRGGSQADLRFLRRSMLTFENFFGVPARNFRSPCWCPLGQPALDELCMLGYHVDSSSNPQRVPLLSSFPWDFRNVLAKRVPHFVRPGLLEIPTSSLLIPLGWPSFCVLRRRASLLFTELLVAESAVNERIVLVAQFHPSDFADEGPGFRIPRRGWRDLIPRRVGGIQARRWFRSTDRRLVAEVSRLVFDRLVGHGPTSLGAIWEEATSGMPL